MNTRFQVKGRLKVTVHRADGTSYTHSETNNLVLDKGLYTLAELVVNGVTTADKITYIKLGDSNTAAAAGQTGIQGTLVGPAQNTFTSAVANAASVWGQADFTTTLGTGDGNGQTIREACLFTAADDCFSRIVISEIAKTSGISVQFDWNLTFSVV